MKMDVTLKTTRSAHLAEPTGSTSTSTTRRRNFGCDKPWFIEGSDGTKLPDYLLTPAPLIARRPDPAVSQTTKGMGVYVERRRP